MSTLRVTTLATQAGVEVYTCKAWVNFNGTGTVAIRASGNVSSITDNGVGEYSFNFATPMQDADYAVSGLANIYQDATPINISLNYTQSSSSFRVRVHSTGGATAFDALQVHVAVFR